jgi:hypothetical protein
MGRVWLACVACLVGLACVGLRAGEPPGEVEASAAYVAQLRIEGRAQATTVALPYHWDRFHPGTTGRAVFGLAFDFDETPQGPQGMYLQRVGNAYEIWVNGWLIDHQGRLDEHNGSDFGQVPRYLSLPPGLLRQHNEVLIHIRADIGRRAGLSPVYVGPAAEVMPLYQQAYFWRVTGSVVVISVSVLVGLISLILWATQRVPRDGGGFRRDALYLSAAVAELAWTFRVGDALVENPPLPWPWWGLVPVVALAVWSAAMGAFCVQVAGWQRQTPARQFLRWLQVMAVLSLPASVSALVYGQPLALTLWYGMLSAGFVAMAVYFVYRALSRGAGFAHRLVALSVVVNVVVGVRDFYVFRINPVHGENTYMRYASLLFGLVLAAIVLYRFKRANDRAHVLNEELAERVRVREQELMGSYRQLEVLAREQARVAERSRILRDMHDGVGSHISAALRLLQSGRAHPGELQQTLQDALDQLKLSIDALNLTPGDVGSLLASLRYRLQPRLEAMGIGLSWQVEVLPQVDRLSSHDMRQLQFILFEAISNVLQHAHARHITFEAWPRGEGVVLRVVDDGRGFDPAQARGKGLPSMRERAQALGARLGIESQPGRTAVELTL